MSAQARPLERADLAAVVAIDAALTGRTRRAYFERRLNAALRQPQLHLQFAVEDGGRLAGHALDEALRESGVRISLAARLEGVTAGFVMARADLGDFGRTEPVAVIDTLGVAPEYARRGLGRALLEQLFLNLDALRIERVETVVAAEALGLLGFFTGTGFAPGQRLAFVRRLGA